MSNEERARILRMVSEGTITPSEAEELLSAMESSSRPGTPPPAGGPTEQPQMPFPPSPPRMPFPPRPPLPSNRSLVIQIDEDGDTKVNLRIPLGLARAAGKFIPRHAQRALEGYDIKLEELLEGLATTEGAGTLLEVQDDDNHVRILVE